MSSAGVNVVGKETVLTRAGRKRAGLPSPPSLFCGKVSHSSDSPKEHTSSPTLIVTERENDHVQQTTGTENATIWVQCDNKKCMKWRRLNKNTTDPLPDMWYCSMHPNSAFQSCDVPEEGWQLENKELFIYHGLKPGQLVWARLGKYPPWPAIVSPDPWSDGNYMCDEQDAGGVIYHVEFLGKPPTHCWLPEEMVEPYRDSCSLMLDGPICPRDMTFNKKLQNCINDADNMLSLSPTQRMQCLHFTDNTKSSQGCSINGRCLKQKKRPKKEPSAGSIVSHPPCPPLPPPELPLPSCTVSSLSMSAESATTAKGTSSSQLITVPLDLLPHHIQQNLLDSQAVLFQLMKPSSVTVSSRSITAPSAAVHKSPKPLVTKTNKSNVPVKLSEAEKTSKSVIPTAATTIATITTSNIKKRGKAAVSNPLKIDKSASHVLTPAQLQGRQQTSGSRQSEIPGQQMSKATRKKARKITTEQSVTIKQFFKPSTAAPPTSADEPHSFEGKCSSASDQVVPSHSTGVFIKNLEDETKNGLVEIESLLTDMEYHIPAHIHKHTILEASTSDKSKKSCLIQGTSLSLDVQQIEVLQELSDIEGLMKELT